MVCHFQRDLLLQEMRAVSQADHLLVEPVEPLRQLARLDLERCVLHLKRVTLEAMNQRSLSCQQAMHAHRDPPRPGERPRLIAELFGHKPLFDVVERLAQRIGMILDRRSDVIDDGFK